MWVPLLNETFAKTWMNYGVFKPSHRAASKQSNIIVIDVLSPTSIPIILIVPVLIIAAIVGFEIFIVLFFLNECFFILSQLITTVLMNDFRLKTFYCKKSSSKKSNKSSVTAKQQLSPTATVPSSTTAAAAAAATASVSALTILSSKSKVKTNSNNNNHLRTYHNSSKSKKVFLYYTPRDPRLRIFQNRKTKQLTRPNRPQCSCKIIRIHLHSPSFQCHSFVDEFSNKSLLKITDDLCNYGELIGGGRRGELTTSGVGEVKHKQQQQKPTSAASVNKSVSVSIRNCDKNRENRPLIKQIEKNVSDKCIIIIVVVASSADIVDTICIAIERRHLAEILLTYCIGALLSFLFSINQKPQLQKQITVFKSYEKI
uniref:Uncharacterized protein n=1 Tax=Stomoxys calcitrans TaxID=35570 RepID=A0A1I8PNU5_STOCA